MFKGVKITDWIQALGTGIAVVAAIISFSRLSETDLEMQYQINSLQELAQQSKAQTIALQGQLDQMVKSNEILVARLKINQHQLTVLKESYQLNANEVLKNDKPFLRIVDYSWQNEELRIKLKNVSGVVKRIEFDKKKYFFNNYENCLSPYPNGTEKFLCADRIKHDKFYVNDFVYVTIKGLDGKKPNLVGTSVHIDYYDIHENKYSLQIFTDNQDRVLMMKW